MVRKTATTKDQPRVPVVFDDLANAEVDSREILRHPSIRHRAAVLEAAALLINWRRKRNIVFFLVFLRLLHPCLAKKKSFESQESLENFNVQFNFRANR